MLHGVHDKCISGDVPVVGHLALERPFCHGDVLIQVLKRMRMLHRP